MVAIAFGKKVSAAFKAKVIEICNRLDCDPSHLMACMAFETGERFRSNVRNPASSATGLIQFMEPIARSLGTTTAELAAMSEVDQLDYVLKYFRRHRGRLNSLSDVYMAILWPAAVGKPDAAVLFRRPSSTYRVNRGLDVNRDGVITKGEAASKVQEKLDRGLSTRFRG
jgi:hypothetical protein